MSIFDNTAKTEITSAVPSSVPAGTLDIGRLIDRDEQTAELVLKRANRHGLVAGATGTGKTVTLHRMAECFARAGVPVFAVDVKGDLAGLMQGNSAIPLDLLGQKGHPVRSTITEFGPTLLSRLLDVNDVQSGVLNVMFRVADAEGLILTDLKDFRATLQFMLDNAQSISRDHGLIAPASVAALQRAIMALENEGGASFFGEPAYDINDLFKTDAQGRGYVSLLDASSLMQKPALYASFLLWMLSELFEQLPEIGDPDKPKLVLFFDEAHLLFKDMPDALVEKIELVVRLIRSKGVGVYFVTQSPADLPPAILGQLGNRVQHALRAFTPQDQKAVKIAADTFRPNPAFDTRETITTLGVGEALVSFLDEKGSPGVVERVKIHLPETPLGAITTAQRDGFIKASPLYGKYDQAVDKESAYERLAARAAKTPAAEPASAPAPKKAAGRPKDTAVEAALKSAVRAAGSQVGHQIARELFRGVLGSLRK